MLDQREFPCAECMSALDRRPLACLLQVFNTGTLEYVCAVFMCVCMSPHTTTRSSLLSSAGCRLPGRARPRPHLNVCVLPPPSLSGLLPILLLLLLLLQASRPFSFCAHPWIYDPASKARIMQLESQMQQLEAFERSVLGVRQLLRMHVVAAMLIMMRGKWL